MKNSQAHRWIVEITTGILILLFTYTGLSKLNDQQSFQLIMSKSPLIGHYSVMIGWVVPVTELIVALLLLIPSTKKIGLWASLLLMTIFTLYIAYILLFSPRLPCSCGGIIQQLSWRNHLLINTVLIILPAVSIWFYKPNKFFIAINRNSRIPV